jgi:hypothetical protein
MPEQNEEYFSRRASAVWLWAGILAGPAAVALTQQVAYLLVTLSCSYGKSVSVWPVMLLTLTLAAGGAFVSWRNWRLAGSGWSSSEGDATSRGRFMAIVGMLFSGLALLVIIAMWLPVVFYRQCQR